MYQEDVGRATRSRSTHPNSLVVSASVYVLLESSTREKYGVLHINLSSRMNEIELSQCEGDI